MVVNAGSFALIRCMLCGVNLFGGLRDFQLYQDCLASWPSWECKYSDSTWQTYWHFCHTMLSSHIPVVSFIDQRALCNTVGILGRNRAFSSVKCMDFCLIRDLFLFGTESAPKNDPMVDQIRTNDLSGMLKTFESRISPWYLTICRHTDECVLFGQRFRYHLRCRFVCFFFVWFFFFFFFFGGGGHGFMGLINYSGIYCEFIFMSLYFSKIAPICCTML